MNTVSTPSLAPHETLLAERFQDSLGRAITAGELVAFLAGLRFSDLVKDDVHIICKTHPGNPGPTTEFIEIENGDGKSVRIGEWSQRDGYDVLSIPLLSSVDAERWRALMSSQRMHLMGSAGFEYVPRPGASDGSKLDNLVPKIRPDQHLLFGMEFWDKHPAHDDPDYPDRFERELLTLYVDTLRARQLTVKA